MNNLFAFVVAITLGVSSFSDAQEIRVLSWNVESDGNNPTTIASELKSFDGYDIVGLCEVKRGEVAAYVEAIAEDEEGAFEHVFTDTGCADRLVLAWNAGRFEHLRTAFLDDLAEGCNRDPIAVKLREKPDGPPFWVMMNHLNRGTASTRNNQSNGVREWLIDQEIPAYAVGDYNFDFDVEDGGGNTAYEIMFGGNEVFWVRPPTLVRTEDSHNSVLDFAISNDPGLAWSPTSTIIVRDDDFTDPLNKADHRPIELVLLPSSHLPMDQPATPRNRARSREYRDLAFDADGIDRLRSIRKASPSHPSASSEENSVLLEGVTTRPPSRLLAEAVEKAKLEAERSGDVGTPSYLKALLANLKKTSTTGNFTEIMGLRKAPLPAPTPALTPPTPLEVSKLKALAASSLFKSETWRLNQLRLINEIGKGKLPRARIFGGRPSLLNEFPDCVAVGSGGQFCCSGTLIGPNVVVTAAHCLDGGCADRIYVGLNSNQPNPSDIYDVRVASKHPGYNPFTSENDIGVLVLDRDVVGVSPRRIAAPADLAGAYFVTLAGYGYTQLGGFGVQCTVDVAIASLTCDCSNCPATYGCHSGFELVAGGNGLDSCNGDSGGPAYLRTDSGETVLIGATSRATGNSTVNCGDGGIYVRVDKYADWIREVAEANGGSVSSGREAAKTQPEKASSAP
jgi:hypothetical protein